MSETRKSTRTLIHRLANLGALLTFTTLSMLVGSRPAQGAVSCISGQTVYMTSPVVTVIDGPGDAAVGQAQAQWSALGESLLGGPLEIGLGERTFELEPVR